MPDVFGLMTMYQITREIDFCYGHRLLNYNGKCRFLHGHNGRAVIKIASETLDERGMVFDFSDVKKIVAGWIDDNLDHRMILNRADPMVAVFEEMDEPVFLLDDNPTAENIARLIFDFTRKAGFPIIEVDLWETPRCFASYTG
jgi:6-pyruvoyltetrahydropterin/6-carboxytetrahydropterin synthase